MLKNSSYCDFPVISVPLEMYQRDVFKKEPSQQTGQILEKYQVKCFILVWNISQAQEKNPNKHPIVYASNITSDEHKSI